ncbi:HWE histidine kinase domain-containing protein [Chelativorans sp. YIM 93263]|uniref:HWE histidine kinase domain-containing protein n=1 Tax=Chelativorans sp. YIM 93263 TaxID=2906648 RepID=UPI002378B4C2|nr:HWE histidine kinase domain-containing protein [Chelativorans sp. YIM 93263]
MCDPAERQAKYLVDAEQLLQGLRHGGVAIWRWHVKNKRLVWSDNAQDVHGLLSDPFNGSLDGFRRDLHPEDAYRVWHTINETVETEEPFCIVYRTAPKGNGICRWIEARGGIISDGGETWLTGTCLDVTDRVEAEQELQRRLRQQKAIEELGSFAVGESSLQAVADRAVALASEVLEVPFSKVLQFTDHGQRLRLIAGVGWQDGLVGSATVGIDQNSQAGFTLREGKPVIVKNLATETRFRGPELLRSHGVVSGMSTIIAGDAGRPFGVFGVHTNVWRGFDQADTEFLTALANIVANSARQIAAGEHRALLVREMAHRAGNMLQLVDTLANRIFMPDRDLEEAKRSFSSRLASLSRANYLVSRGGWSLTRFQELAEETLEAFEDRIRMAGEDVLLPPELCFDLGLVLHELSTNGVKYGSLGSDDGPVEVSWWTSEETGEMQRFHFEWLDRLCTVPEARERAGFGSRLMRLIIERKWAGRVDQKSAEEGYRFAFDLPFTASEPLE